VIVINNVGATYAGVYSMTLRVTSIAATQSDSTIVINFPVTVTLQAHCTESTSLPAAGSFDATFKAFTPPLNPISLSLGGFNGDCGYSVSLGPVSGGPTPGLFSVTSPVFTRLGAYPYPVTSTTPAELNISSFTDNDAGVYLFDLILTQEPGGAGGIYIFPVKITLEPKPCI
jgi:hypothetical protein